MISYLRLIAAAAALVGATAASAQQGYGSTPIRWIIPFSPGGFTDAVTRIVAAKITEHTGWTFVVENKPGANSIIGVDQAAKSAPDGYTLVSAIPSIAANATFRAGKLPYDTLRDLTPISLVGTVPLMLVANAKFPPKNIKELTEYSKANPGKLFFGSSGAGSASHLTGELFVQATGIPMTHVPYKGSGAGMIDLAGGNIPLMVDSPASSMAAMRAGTVRAIALFASKRSTSAPEVPTMVEAGGPAIESSSWLMFLAPAKTPPEIVNRLAMETKKALALDDVKQRVGSTGMDLVGSTPEEANKFLREEMEKWAKVIRTAGIKAD